MALMDDPRSNKVTNYLQDGQSRHLSGSCQLLKGLLPRYTIAKTEHFTLEKMRKLIEVKSKRKCMKCLFHNDINEKCKYKCSTKSYDI